MMALLIIPLMIGTTEIVLLAGVALLLFGGKKLPEMMRNMGRGVKEFKEGVQGASQEFEAGMKEDGESDSKSVTRDEKLQEGMQTSANDEE